MLSKQGVAALLEVKAQKLANPDSLDMATYTKYSNCGTVSCIAGQLIINNFAAEGVTDIFDIEQSLEASRLSYSQAASKILGFTDKNWEVIYGLFHQTCWPDEFYYSYVKAEAHSKQRAEILGQVIDWFIKKYYKPE